MANHNRKERVYTMISKFRLAAATISILGFVSPSADAATDLGGDMSGIPGASISSWGPSRLDVWATGLDHIVYHRACNGACDGATAWEGWDNIGGSIFSKPAAVSWGLNRIDVFGLNSSGSVMHKWFINGSGWSDWFNELGGSGYTDIAASSQGSGLIDVFTRRTDGKVDFRQFNTSWTNWGTVPGNGNVGSSLSSTSWGPNRIDLAGFNSSNPRNNPHAWASPGWGAFWDTLPTAPADCDTGQALAAHGSEILIAFCSSANDSLYYSKRFASGNWNPWVDIGVFHNVTWRLHGAIGRSGHGMDYLYTDTTNQHLIHGQRS